MSTQSDRGTNNLTNRKHELPAMQALSTILDTRGLSLTDLETQAPLISIGGISERYSGALQNSAYARAVKGAPTYALEMIPMPAPAISRPTVKRLVVSTI